MSLKLRKPCFYFNCECGLAKSKITEMIQDFLQPVPVHYYIWIWNVWGPSGEEAVCCKEPFVFSLKARSRGDFVMLHWDLRSQFTHWSKFLMKEHMKLTQNRASVSTLTISCITYSTVFFTFPLDWNVRKFLIIQYIHWAKHSPVSWPFLESL